MIPLNLSFFKGRVRWQTNETPLLNRLKQISLILLLTASLPSWSSAQCIDCSLANVNVIVECDSDIPLPSEVVLVNPACPTVAITFVDVDVTAGTGASTSPHVFDRTYTYDPDGIPGTGDEETCTQNITVQATATTFEYTNCPGDIFEVLGSGECGEIVYFNVEATGECVIIDQVDGSGYSSGDVFPIGVTVLEFEITDLLNAVPLTCTFSVNIIEAVEDGTPNCVEGNQISVDENCMIILNAAQVLSSDISCYENYTLNVVGLTETVAGSITGNGTSEVIIDAQGIDGFADNGMAGPFNVMVVYPSGNSCWAENLTIADKLAPEICCTDFSVNCIAAANPASIVNGSRSWSASGYPISGLDPVAPSPFGVLEIPVEVDACENINLSAISVFLDIEHEQIGDVTVQLISPLGTTALLFDRPGVPTVSAAGCAGLDVANWFVTASSNPHSDLEEDCTLPSGAGTGNAIQAASALNPAFLGEAIAGTWTVRVIDNNENTLTATVNNVVLSISGNYGEILYTENCSTTEPDYTDVISQPSCTGTYQTITRTWTASDAKGNTAECVQTITVNRVSIRNVVCPPDYNNMDLPAIACDEVFPPDDEGHPHPSHTNEPRIGGLSVHQFCMFDRIYEDQVFPGCGNTYDIYRTWTIVDWCTGEDTTCVQIIKIMDSVDPVIECPDDFTTGTTGTNASCMATIDLDPPTTLTDNCTNDLTYLVTSSAGTPSMTGGVWTISGLPLGVHTVTYSTTDDCGNTNSCDYEITVEDDDPPPCAGTTNVTVNLNSTSSNVFWSSFINQTTLDLIDNCSVSTALVKRGNDSWCAPTNVATNYDIFVPVHCCDAGQVVPVTLQLTDAAGNDNECDVLIMVTDGSPATFNSCPVTADVPVQCDDLSPLDPPYAGVIQTVTDIPVTYIDENQDLIPVGWYDPANVTYTCDAEVFIYDTGELASLCGTGTITRTYELRNANGVVTDDCSFDFVVTNPPFVPADVTWPAAEVTRDCANIGTAPDPILNGLSCDHLGLAPVDLVFEIGDPSVCFKIIREWNLVDCCVDPDNANVIVDNFTQVIKVTDATAPLITTCTADASVDEGEDVSFEFTATDCTDAYNGPGQVAPVSLTYTIDHSNGNPQSLGLASGLTTAAVTTGGALFPVGINTVTFIATDACGNSSACEVVITVANVVDCNDVVAELPLLFPFNVGFGGLTMTPSNPLIYTNGATAPAGTMLSLDGSTQVPLFNFNCDMLVYTNPYGPNSPTLVNFYVHLPGENTPCMSSAQIRDAIAPTLTCPPAINVVQGTPIDVLATATDVCTDPNDIQFEYQIDQNSDDNNNTIEIPKTVGVLGTAEATGSSSAFFPVGQHTVTYFATDLYGNTSSCAIQVIISENAPPMGNVSGAIGNEEAGMLANVTVSPSQGMDVVTTDEDGLFNLNLPTSENYDITPVKDDDYLNGVSTYDIVLISKHVLGIDSLDSPYKMIAGDINKSDDLTTLDMILLRKIVLFIDLEFQNNTSWRFVDANYVFNNPTNPFDESYPESYPINGLNSDMNDIDFIAVKTGDVNCSAIVNLNGEGDDRDFNGQLRLRMEEQGLRAGEIYKIDVKANDFNEILGYQFTLGFDENVIEVLDVLEADLPGLTDNNFNLQGVTQGVITTSWNQQTAVSLEDNTVLFTLEVKAKQDVSVSELFNVSSRYTAAEAYKEDGANVDLMDVVFEYQGASGEVLEADGFALFQNRPNPFKNETMISFNLPEAGFASLKIYDLSGKTLFRISGDYDKGYNELNIDRSELSATGVLYYELSTAKHTALQKMIVID